MATSIWLLRPGVSAKSEDDAPASRTRYIETMQYVLPALVVIAMLATLGTLFLGIISMAKGGNPQRSNKLMRSRVLLQGAALILFVIFMLIYRHG
jgi:ABC-type Na+ efflux pump permease subunit